jgi:WD40 repeat protein
LNGHSGTVHTIDCNYDGSQIISGSNDTTMKYWYLNTWGNYQLNYTFTGSGKPIYGLDFSSDQIIIASGGDDKKLWTWKYSLSCSNILNTNGSFNSTVCFCKSGYSWNYRNFSCNLQNLNCLT